MARVAIGLGSNLNDRLTHLRRAVVALGAIGTLIGSSSVYETAPVGGPAQGPFLNAVAVIDTARSPEMLLAEIRAVERVEGRERRLRWGPRTLDLDLLLYDRDVVDLPGLSIPHPRMLERCFVLVPLLEAWPEAVLPDGAVPLFQGPESSGQDVVRLTDDLMNRAG